MRRRLNFQRKVEGKGDREVSQFLQKHHVPFTFAGPIAENVVEQREKSTSDHNSDVKFSL